MIVEQENVLEEFPVGEYVCIAPEIGSLLDDFITNDLSVSDFAVFERHLAECSYCQEIVLQWKATVEMLHRKSNNRANVMCANS